MVKFFRGPADKYDVSLHADGLYFATDKGEIYLNGKTYGSGDAEQLRTDLNALELTVENLGKTVAAIDLSPYATVEAMNEALAGKVSTEGYVAFSQEEKDKLATIAEGAQVNVIEKVVFNGEEISVENKTITLATPEIAVKGVAEDDRFLSLNAENGKLNTTVGLTYYTDTTGETPVYEIQLTGKNGEVVSKIDAKGFVKDGMLSSVELVSDPTADIEGTYLVFTWNTEAGVSEPMYVAVTDLIDVYVAGNGVEISDKTISAKVKASDPYLEVTAEGLATKGIDSAIGVVSEAVEDLADIVATIKVTDVDTTAVNGVNLTKTEAGVVGVTVTVNDLATSLLGNTGEAGPVSGVTVKLGQAIEGVGTATTNVTAAISSLAGQIKAAVAGGITSITGDEYISVDDSEATSRVLSLNVAKIGSYMVDNKASALKVSEDGKLTLEWETIE